MKKFLGLLLVSIPVGFVTFAICRWLIKTDFANSIIAAISAAGAGLIVEYLRSYSERRIKDKIGER